MNRSSSSVTRLRKARRQIRQLKLLCIFQEHVISHLARTIEAKRIAEGAYDYARGM